MAPTANSIPDLLYVTPEGQQRSRWEMDEWIRKEFAKVHWLRIIAGREFGLPKQIAFDMKEIVLRHWLLDEMVRLQRIHGDVLGINQAASNDEAEIRQFTQRLIALVQSGQAVPPQQAEGVEMNGFTPPPPPVMNAAPANGAPQHPPGSPQYQQAMNTAYPPGPPSAPQMGPPMGAPPMGPPSFAPGPQQPQGPAPQQYQPQISQPPQQPQMGPPGYAPQGPPNMGPPQGPPGVPQMGPPMGPPNMGPPPGAPPQQQAAPSGGGRRGRKPAAEQQAQPQQQQLPQMGPPPQQPQFSGPPQGQAPQGFSPLPQMPQIPQMPQQMNSTPNSDGAPALHQKLDLILANQNKQAKDLEVFSIVMTVLARAMYQKPGSANIRDFLNEVGMPFPQ